MLTQISDEGGTCVGILLRRRGRASEGKVHSSVVWIDKGQERRKARPRFHHELFPEKVRVLESYATRRRIRERNISIWSLTWRDELFFCCLYDEMRSVYANDPRARYICTVEY
jgi:hypothetical protein